MNVSLTRELEQFIDSKVATGMYGSASEVVREGLRLLEERDELIALRREKLRQEIQVGLNQLARGEYTEYTDETLPQLFEDIKAEGRARLAREGRK